MTKKRKMGMTLAEHDAMLKASGEYDSMVDRQRRQEEVRLQREAEFRIAEAPLVDDLRAAGINVVSVWDLVNASVQYAHVLGILLEHLQRPYPAPVREGIARALAVPESSFAWRVLLKLFREEQERRVKDGLACAIAACADDASIEDVIALVRDRKHSSSRILLLSALERSTRPHARATLMDLGTDPELMKEIQIILRRVRQRAEESVR